MPPSKTIASKRKSSRSRREQLKRARQSVGTTPEPPRPGQTSSHPPTTPQSASPSGPPTPEPSASKRKLCLFPKDDRPTPSAVLGTSYIFCDVNMLQFLLEQLICPQCHSKSLIISCHQENHMGMAARLEIHCTVCEESVSSTDSSPKVTAQNYDVNRRATLAFANIGLGHAAMTSFCEVFGMRPLGESAHLSTMGKICDAADRSKDSLLDDAADKIREAYEKYNVASPDVDGVLDITVSYDGSWPTRGRRSKHGVGCVVESVTGLVIDYEAMSLYCQRCETIGERLREQDPEAHKEWLIKHAPECLINHTGSSGAMEVQAAKALWGRSLQRKFRYLTMISDGDCKTYNELSKLKPYGEDHLVSKEECINHFAKRIGTALKNVVEVEKARGVTLGGNKKGSLTVKKMATFQSYFQRAILDNKGSLEGMRKAVWATYFHAVSTDENPQHQNCPSGEGSWCRYQKALAQKLPPPPHKSSIIVNDKVAAYIKPVYERLTSDDLLGRCLQGKTQNANESLHSVIWSLSPKSTFVGARRVKLALYLGSGQFNRGSSSLRDLLENLSLATNSHTEFLGQRRDSERVARAEKYSSDLFKQRREKRRAAHLQAQAEIAAAEGEPAYAPGAY